MTYLYEGQADKIRDLDDKNAPEISLTTNDITFALARITETRLCGYIIFRVEHPKLFIMEMQPGAVLTRKRKVTAENLDIFTYVNSKFVYIEKHFRMQLTDFYNDVTAQKCELERQIVMHALTLATQDPIEFAYNIMNGLGYTAIQAREVIHMIKCVPIITHLRHAEKCYNELSVIYNNGNYFLTSKTRILKRIGCEECNAVFPPEFLSEHGRMRLLPKAIDTNTPTVLNPETPVSWQYLFSSQLNELREHLMFPAKQQSISNNAARTMLGRQQLDNGLSIINLLSEEALDRIAKSTSEKI